MTQEQNVVLTSMTQEQLKALYKDTLAREYKLLKEAQKAFRKMERLAKIREEIENHCESGYIEIVLTPNDLPSRVISFGVHRIAERKAKENAVADDVSCEEIGQPVGA